MPALSGQPDEHRGPGPEGPPALGQRRKRLQVGRPRQPIEARRVSEDLGLRPSAAAHRQSRWRAARSTRRRTGRSRAGAAAQPRPVRDRAGVDAEGSSAPSSAAPATSRSRMSFCIERPGNWSPSSSRCRGWGKAISSRPASWKLSPSWRPSSSRTRAAWRAARRAEMTRPRRGLVGGGEEDGSLAGMGALEGADDRLGAPDRLELRAVVIEGEDPADLCQRRLGACAVAELELDVEPGASGPVWRMTAPAYPWPPSTPKASRMRAVKRRGAAVGGAEAELRRRAERERSADGQMLDFGHGQQCTRWTKGLYPVRSHGRARRIPQDPPSRLRQARPCRAGGRLPAVLPGPARGRAAPPGCAVHGLRGAVLP